MKNKNNTIFWVIGAVALLLVVARLPLPGFPFAIVTKTTCMDGTISYWDLEGNVLDAQGLNNGVNYDAIFVPGKLGQAIEFNTTTYINFPAVNAVSTAMWIKDYSTGSGWYFVIDSNGTNYVNNVLDNTKQIIPIGLNFGLGFNGSVDELSTFDKELTLEEMSTMYSVKKVCYTVSYEENVSCQDYATEQVTDPGTGCLNYSGDFFPNCEYEWITDSQYYILENECERYFYCQDSCFPANNCYITEQGCIEYLIYECYVLENEACVYKTDYESCVVEISYSNITDCQEDLPVGEGEIATPTPYTAPPEEETFTSKLSKTLFAIGGIEIKLIHLIIALIVVVTLIYFMKDGKK